MIKLCRNFFWITCFLLFCLVAGFSCTHNPEADNQKPIRFAYQNRVGSAACIIAVDNGLFTKDNLNVESFRFNSGPACAEALYSGSVDIATMGDTTAVIAVAKNPGLMIIGSHGKGEHRHRMIVKKNSDIKTLIDIKGKRLAVKKGTSTYGGLLALLSLKGIALSELEIIDLAPSQMAEALISGSIDAFVASEPTPSIAESTGGKELVTLGGLGNQYPILMVIKKSFFEKRSHDISKFLKAIEKAEQFIKDNPQKAVDAMAKATGLDVILTENAMKRHSFEFIFDDKIVESLIKTAIFLKEQNIIEKIPDFNKSMVRKK